jgi:hypothetical protein
MFAGGVIAVFVTATGGGSTALIGVGAALILLSALGDRIEALEIGGARLNLRDLARDRLALADQKAAAGDPTASRELRHQGLALARLANEYAHRRRTMRSGPRRTAALEHIVEQLGRLAQEHPFDPAVVWDWFDRGKPEARITAIGLMHGDENLRDLFVALSAIEDSRSAFEQFHGLRLAWEMLPGLTDLEKDWLRQSVLAARESGRFGPETDRWRLTDRMLSQLQR